MRKHLFRLRIVRDTERVTSLQSYLRVNTMLAENVARVVLRLLRRVGVLQVSLQDESEYERSKKSRTIPCGHQ